MPRRAALATLAFALSTLIACAQEATSSPRSALRQFMRDATKAKIQNGEPSEIQPAQTTTTTSEPVQMKPFVVEEKRTPRIAGIDEEMQKQKALESHALYHVDLAKKVRVEIGLPPAPGGMGGMGGMGGGFSLPVLRLSW